MPTASPSPSHAHLEVPFSKALEDTERAKIVLGKWLNSYPPYIELLSKVANLKAQLTPTEQLAMLHAQTQTPPEFTSPINRKEKFLNLLGKRSERQETLLGMAANATTQLKNREIADQEKRQEIAKCISNFVTLNLVMSDDLKWQLDTIEHFQRKFSNANARQVEIPSYDIQRPEVPPEFRPPPGFFDAQLKMDNQRRDSELISIAASTVGFSKRLSSHKDCRVKSPDGSLNIELQVPSTNYLMVAVDLERTYDEFRSHRRTTDAAWRFESAINREHSHCLIVHGVLQALLNPLG